jgi:hypothetical protein
MNRFFRWFGLPGSLVLTTLMSIYAVTLAVIFRNVPHYIAVFAMLLSSLGDIVLMDYKPITSHLHLHGSFSGASLFMLSHLLYIATFGYKIFVGGYIYINTGFYIAAFTFIILSVACTAISLIRKSSGRNLIIPCILYLFVISLNCATVYSYAFSAGGKGIISAAGILSFLISDCFIILKDVCGIKSKTLSKLIWWFYPIGQILLLSGI